MKLNERLYELRKSNNWSQEELAEKMEVSRQTISKWESGKATPELNKLVKLAELYKITLDELVKGEKAEYVPKENKRKATINTKKLLIIFLVLLVIFLIMFSLNIVRRMFVVHGMAEKYKNNFINIGKTQNGYIMERVRKKTFTNIEEIEKQYWYYVSEDGEKLLKIKSYIVNNDEKYYREPFEEIYIDLNKEIENNNDFYTHYYDDVLKINLKDGTQEKLNDYEVIPPTSKVTSGMNDNYSIIWDYNKAIPSFRIIFDFDNKLWKNNKTYIWNNNAINNSGKSIHIDFDDIELYMHLDKIINFNDIKEEREITDIVMLNGIILSREHMLPPEN